MRCGILLSGDRVAARGALPDSLLVAFCKAGRLAGAMLVHIGRRELRTLLRFLRRQRVDVLVCGSLPAEIHRNLRARGIEVVAGLSATADELLAALDSGAPHLTFDLQRPPWTGLGGFGAAVAAALQRSA
jgi:hypothetical protein